LLMIFTTLTNSSPYVAGILMGVIVFWIIATRSLGRQFAALAVNQTEPDAEEPVLEVDNQLQPVPVK
jgi:ATP/ADP translocase